MDITAPRSNRQQSVCTAWGVPWPSDEDLRMEAETAWAIEVGLVDPGAFDAETIGVLDPEISCAAPAELLDELERRVRERHRATAAEYRLVRLVLARAAADPVPWVGPDPTLDLAWNDTRGRTVAAVRRDRRDMAERAAIAEMATRLCVSEQTVRARAANSDTLQTRCPEVWAAFVEGSISERHAIESARLATSLPDAEVVTVAVPTATPPESPDELGLGSAELDSANDDCPAGDGALTPDPSCATPASEGHESWRAFDEGALDRALHLPPARFVAAARSLRERVHRESLEARHRRATRDRGVWLTAELDGMATLSALLPVDRAAAAMARIDRAARHLRVAADEDRTLAQLRADVFADFVTTSPAPPAQPTPLTTPATQTDSSADGTSALRSSGSRAPGSSGSVGTASGSGGSAVRGSTPAAPAGPLSPTAATPASTRRAAVVVTVPALTLLGAGTEPAVLDGYGPIDLDTARRLAGEATSWVRVLTHPLTGVPLALDRSTYRVPTALRRWLGVTSPTCVFPGCGRSARDCDLDHLTAWIDGGRTDDDNLAPECRHHHRLRHESRWHPSRDPDTGDLRWTSPLGAQIAEDPPPF
ncbi:HNH endonuclease signature motif containing protein [Microbacterium sp. Leaf151]|uniref:HNH endonuclease signature motif containing protein n=1 Tax=Microbacterium sp. Leaf151 TaxID=1736276 RepID=UPI0009EB45D5|nr:HNH endonuclease signature motif containing protein [Microbacterium sp. Leaf151]